MNAERLSPGITLIWQDGDASGSQEFARKKKLVSSRSKGRAVSGETSFFG
jgi:hypothetical protein